MPSDAGFYDLSPWRAFRSQPNDSMGPTTVAASPRGWLIGGYYGKGGGNLERPIVWPSANGRVWGDRITLPTPPGFRSAGVTSIVDAGGKWVAAGWVRKTDNAQPGWASWTSAGPGTHWRLGAVVVPEEGTLDKLVVTPEHGVLALGSTGPSANSDAAAWYSADGVHWKPDRLGVDDEAATGDGVAEFDDGVFDGGRLHLLGSSVSSDTKGPYTVTVPWKAPS